MPETDPRPDPGRRPLARSSRIPIVLGILLVIAGALWLWLWRGRETSPPPPTPEAAPTTERGALPPAYEATEPAPGGAPPAAAPVPPEDARALLEAVSPDPELRRRLAADDLAERWAAVTENLARGESPAPHLPFLRPARPFSTVERGGRTVVSPASHARYDRFAELVSSVDAAAFARAYRALRGPLDAAHRALGGPGGSIDRASARALQRILAAPAPEGDLAVVDEGGVFVYEDPALERLSAVDKHFLRMGPRNARRVQAKAREIGEALGLPAAPHQGAAR